MTDRRIQKTKKLLSEALITLILEKDYEQITIQDILDKANVGRSTFYYHYESKEQLLIDGHKNLDVAFFKIDQPLDFTYFFTHVCENKRLAKAMFGKKSGNIFLTHLKAHLAEKICLEYATNFSKTKHDKKMLQYLSDGAAALVISITVSWLEDDMLFSISEIANTCKRITTAIFE